MANVQYTIRNVHPEIDRVLRTLAARENRSLNTVIVEALKVGLGLGTTPLNNPDFDDLSGSWRKDPKCEAVLDSMRKSIDAELWK